jgi:DNA-binding transcriptional LysR family regulator
VYNITFQQIAIFLAVAERLNVSETASALYTSQSALSKTIHRLEESLNLKLFVRSNRGLALTREGKFLYTKLQDPYSMMCKNIQMAKDMQKTKMLRIGYPSTYDASKDYDKLKKLVNEYAAQHPEIDLNEILYDFMELKQALIYGDVDIAFTHDFLIRNVPNISMKKVCRVRMCLAMSAKHPLASAQRFQEIDKKAFDNEIFFGLMFNDEGRDREATTRVLNKYGIYPKEVRFSLNFQSLMRDVRQGRGMTICGYFPNATGREEMRFLEFPHAEDDPFLTLAWRTNDVSPEAQHFIDIIPEDPENMTNERQEFKEQQ